LHPGLPDKPKSRRTSEEVTAATTQKEELKAQLAKEALENIELLARMEAQEDREAQAEDAAAVRNLRDMEPSWSPSGTDSEDEECDDDEKNGSDSTKDRVVSKKVHTCKSTANCNTNTLLRTEKGWAS